ncbi:MAG: hypothetical protein JKY01_12910 [Pseudomonadales bacterium]|nr:hypothetical protein [Pseudomonadales bacterium]
MRQPVICSVTTGSANSYFTYDGSERRIKQVANGEATLYLALGYERVLKPAQTENGLFYQAVGSRLEYD